MNEPNKELDSALHILTNYIGCSDCQNCPSRYECGLLNHTGSEDFCIISNAFDIIHQEILRIKD